MNFKTLWFLARKDLSRNLLVLSLVVLAVGSGALVIIPLNGILNGFIQSFYATTIDVSTGHISVVPAKDSKYLDYPEIIKEKIAATPDVKAVSIRLTDKIFLSKSEESVAAVIVGVNPKDEGKVVTLPAKVIKGAYLSNYDTKKVLLGKDLSSDLNLKVGEKVNFALPNGKKGTFTVGGIYSTVRLGEINFAEYDWFA